MGKLSNETTTETTPLRQQQQQQQQEEWVDCVYDPYFHFIAMSVMFSATHGAVLSCLSLATSRLGTNLGAWQSSILYFSYTFSSILGATLVVKQWGSRLAIFGGMALYCVYVACFSLADVWGGVVADVIELLGGFIGGIGGGFLWTAQGAYFAQSSKAYAMILHKKHGGSLEEAEKSVTSSFGGIFAFIYLAEEVLLRLLSTVLIDELDVSWGFVFAVYTVIAIGATFGVLWIHDYDANNQPEEEENEEKATSLDKITVALKLLIEDPKMKYMLGLNAVFGMAAAFLNTYVNGQVVHTVFGNDTPVGSLNAMTAAVAAIFSLIFGYLTQSVGKGPVLILGALMFSWVGGSFLIKPDIQTWSIPMLCSVFISHGVGRSTFEGTLRAAFADYFPQEHVGAFANIILQNGLSSTIGYYLPLALLCSDENQKGCAQFRDGEYHNVAAFEWIVVGTAVMAILGYWRASVLHSREKHTETTDGEELNA